MSKTRLWPENLLEIYILNIYIHGPKNLIHNFRVKSSTLIRKLNPSCGSSFLWDIWINTFKRQNSLFLNKNRIIIVPQSFSQNVLEINFSNKFSKLLKILVSLSRNFIKIVWKLWPVMKLSSSNCRKIVSKLFLNWLEIV